DRDPGPILPAVRALRRAREPHARLGPTQVLDLARALAGAERAPAQRQAAALPGALAREDGDHAGERRDAVERALRAFHDLDTVDVLDRDLRERGIEGSADRHAVERYEQGVELLEAPQPEVGQQRAVVRALAGVEPDHVLERLGERARAAPAQVVAA